MPYLGKLTLILKYLGLHFSLNVESTDSEIPSEESEIESSESDDDSDDLNDKNDSEFTSIVDANDVKNWIPKCDDKKKPHKNQHFSTLKDAYVFYRNYGSSCGFDVRYSTQKTDKKGNVCKIYTM